MSGPPVLRARALERSYVVGGGWLRASATLQALRGVSFELHPGRTLAVVGESGCGKSTLGRLVTLIEPPTGGQLEIDGSDVATASGEARARLRKAVQIVFQDPYGSLNPRKKVSAILDEPLRINTSVGRKERAEAVAEMMAKVGLRPEFASRYPHMFSGGQRQRIAVARALMLRPKIVVLDEPVSALDVSIQAQVLNLLLDLQEQLGLAYLLISHDLSVVRHVADEVAVMYLGRFVEHGSRDEVFAHTLHPYTRALQASSPSTDPALRSRRIAVRGELPSPLNPPPACAFNPRCPYANERCRTEYPELQPYGRSPHLHACHGVAERRIPDLPEAGSSHRVSRPWTR